MRFVPNGVGNELEEQILALEKGADSLEGEALEKAQKEMDTLTKKLQTQRKKAEVVLTFSTANVKQEVIRNRWLWKLTAGELEEANSETEPDARQVALMFNMYGFAASLAGAVIPDQCRNFEVPDDLDGWLEELPSEVFFEARDVVHTLNPTWAPEPMEQGLAEEEQAEVVAEKND